ncbi:hypothetical protein M5E89_05225 [Acidaminococcus intestini]|nr:hypothetical protein M5E89_05225 [Acidaminococcus intestini]
MRCLPWGLPFGAIEERSHIVQLIQDLKAENRSVYALLAPSFVGQFGLKVSPGQIKKPAACWALRKSRKLPLGQI